MNTKSIIFNQDTVIPGHPKFNKDEMYFLEDQLADELVNRGVAEYFRPSAPKAAAKATKTSKIQTS